ncbi:peptidase S8/S53 domain-containing protein [Xylariaceae sp. FL1272]|nr:peptidase S8/S53 domain-containing protein [Xylariaceae sp. FL1272]
MVRFFQIWSFTFLANLATIVHGYIQYNVTTTIPGVPDHTSAPNSRLGGNTAESDVIKDAYIVLLDDSTEFNDSFLQRVQQVTGSKATLRVNLLGDLLNAMSIQLETTPIQVDPAEAIKMLSGVLAVDPIRIHTQPAVRFQPVEDSDANLFKRQKPVEGNLTSPDTMTQVDKLRAMGYNGSGIRIAIIDAPIDYTHPALGGCYGPGCLVSFGRSWLEPVDANDPTPECKSHATALAGVIAAQPNTVGFTGVAPGVQLGSYAVFGCTYGGTDEKLLQALQQGLDDDVDILVYSAGFGNGWTSLTLNLAFNAIIEKGIMIVGAAGNSGGNGVFNSVHPADALDVLGVGAVDPLLTTDLANVSTSMIDVKAFEFAWRDGIAGSPNTVGWGNTVLPLYTNLNKTRPGSGCITLPTNAPDLSTHIVLMLRPGCSDQDIATNAKNAKYVIIGNNNIDQVIEVPRATQPSIKAIAMVDNQTAYNWMQALTAGKQVTLNMTFDPFKRRRLVENGHNTGRVSSFSSWGPTFDGYITSSVVAPGSQLLTTTPVGPGQQGYALVSGTSVAGPYAAAVAALVAQKRKTKDWKTLSSLLATTSQPLKRATDSSVWNDPGVELASVAQQGGGLVQAYNAAMAPCVLSVKSLNFNDTGHRKNLTFSIANTSPTSITFNLNNIPAGSVYTFKEDDLARVGTYDEIRDELYAKDAPGVLTFLPPKVTVPPNGGVAEVEVIAKAPKLNQTRLGVFSGWVALNGSTGFNYTLPYLGIAGSLSNTPALTSLIWRLTDPNALPGAEPRPIISPGRVVHLPSEVPILQITIGMGLRSVQWDVINATTGAVLGAAGLPSYERASRVSYLTSWSCTFANGTRLPSGKFKLVARSLKTFGIASHSGDYLTLESPELDIAWD